MLRQEGDLDGNHFSPDFMAESERLGSSLSSRGLIKTTYFR